MDFATVLRGGIGCGGNTPSRTAITVRRPSFFRNLFDDCACEVDSFEVHSDMVGKKKMKRTGGVEIDDSGRKKKKKGGGKPGPIFYPPPLPEGDLIARPQPAPYPERPNPHARPRPGGLPITRPTGEEVGYGDKPGKGRKRQIQKKDLKTLKKALKRDLKDARIAAKQRKALAEHENERAALEDSDPWFDQEASDPRDGGAMPGYDTNLGGSVNEVLTASAPVYQQQSAASVAGPQQLALPPTLNSAIQSLPPPSGGGLLDRLNDIIFGGTGLFDYEDDPADLVDVATATGEASDFLGFLAPVGAAIASAASGIVGAVGPAAGEALSSKITGRKGEKSSAPAPKPAKPKTRVVTKTVRVPVTPEWAKPSVLLGGAALIGAGAYLIGRKKDA